MPRKKQSTYLVSLIVPAYKQSGTIVKNLRQLLKALKDIRYKYEVIVVVDGMVDSTFEKIKKANLAYVTCLAYEKNRGKGFAIRLGMSKAKGNYIMFIDSGMEIDPNGISMLLEHMEWYEADVIVGSKRHPASLVNYVWQRKILSYGYYYGVRLLFGIKLRDTQAGIKVFKREVIAKVLPRLVEKRFAGDLEMLVVASSLGFKRIFEAPIKLNYEFSELTSAATWKSIFYIIQDTLAIFYRRYYLQYYKKQHHRTVAPRKLHSFTSNKKHV